MTTIEVLQLIEAFAIVIFGVIEIAIEINKEVTVPHQQNG